MLAVAEAVVCVFSHVRASRCCSTSKYIYINRRCRCRNGERYDKTDTKLSFGVLLSLSLSTSRSLHFSLSLSPDSLRAKEISRFVCVCARCYCCWLFTIVLPIDAKINNNTMIVQPFGVSALRNNVVRRRNLLHKDILMRSHRHRHTH